MQWIRRILMVVGALTIMYLLVAAGRRSAGVQIDTWGQNPTTPVCNHPPTDSPPVFPPDINNPVAPPAPPQPLLPPQGSEVRRSSVVRTTDEELAEDYAAAVRRGQIPDN